MNAKKALLIALVLVVLLGGFGVYWFVLRDDAPEELAATDTSKGETVACATGEAPTSFDGTWTITDACENTAGLRIDETFTGGVDHTAVGRTDQVAGTVTVAGSEITAAEFTVDLTALEFTDSPPGMSVSLRTNAMKDRGLQTSQFPEATFELTESVTLPSAPAAGFSEAVEVTGDLTLHGVTKTVTFTVDARQMGNLIELTTAAPVPVVLADYEMEKPTFGPIASIADEGSFEFKIYLANG